MPVRDWWRRTTLVRWALIVAVLGIAAAQVRVRTDLARLLPADQPELVRTARFFENQGAAQILAVEAYAPGRLDRAVALLRGLGRELEPRGVRVLGSFDEAAASRMLNAIRAQLPALVDERDLAALERGIQPVALAERLAGISAAMRKADLGFGAPQLYRDVLGLEFAILKRLQASQTGIDPQHGVALHRDGSYAVLLLEGGFPPSQAGPTAALMDALHQAGVRAAAEGIRLEPIGSYRHFHENDQLITSALFSSLPLSLLGILLLMWTLIRGLWPLCALHLPAVLGLLGGIAGLAAFFRGDVPLVLLGFGAGILGVAIDYGVHMVRGIQAGSAATVVRPLWMSFLTSAAAFACLAASPVPVIQGMGIFLLAGLATAVLAAVDLLPRLLAAGHEPDRWRIVTAPLAGWVARANPRRWWLVAGLTLAAGAGLPLLRFSDRLDDFDGSSPATKQALADFQERWGLLGGANFVVGSGTKDVDAVLRSVAEAKARAGVPDSLVEILLPDRRRQLRRVETWNRFWADHAEAFEHNLAEACRGQHLRAAAFAPSVENYRRPASPPPVEPATWQDTPLAGFLDRLVARDVDGWRVASPVVDDRPEELARIDQAMVSDRTAAADLVWLASRRGLARFLVAMIKDELLWRGGFILIAIAVMLVVIERRPRRLFAMALPPLAALIWVFGLFGWLGERLLPFHVLVGAFVAGIGIDNAIFMSRPEHRRAALSPMLATTATTLIGVGSLALSAHPILASTGTAIVVGMSACLAACLLIGPLVVPNIADDGLL